MRQEGRYSKQQAPALSQEPQCYTACNGVVMVELLVLDLVHHFFIARALCFQLTSTSHWSGIFLELTWYPRPLQPPKAVYKLAELGLLHGHIASGQRFLEQPVQRSFRVS